MFVDCIFACGRWKKRSNNVALLFSFFFFFNCMPFTKCTYGNTWLFKNVK
jgi:hypothetical protein